MTILTKIGNLQGVRVIKEVYLENVEIDQEVVENGLLLKPIKKMQGKKRKRILDQFQKKTKIKKYKSTFDIILIYDNQFEVRSYTI